MIQALLLTLASSPSMHAVLILSTVLAQEGGPGGSGKPSGDKQKVSPPVLLRHSLIRNRL